MLTSVRQCKTGFPRARDNRLGARDNIRIRLLSVWCMQWRLRCGRAVVVSMHACL